MCGVIHLKKCEDDNTFHFGSHISVESTVRYLKRQLKCDQMQNPFINTFCMPFERVTLNQPKMSDYFDTCQRSFISLAAV